MKAILEKQPVSMSAPCRIDLGGTLDISTFFSPLRHLSPTTVNLALDMRTTITLYPWASDHVKISSRGFESAEFKKGEAPLTHPLGLMFSICEYFDAQGVHIDIQSTSPPRSALGGSSVAAVTLIAALMKAKELCPSGILPLDQIVLLAYGIESSVLRVPCGMQDQLAAAYGGVNAWRFTGDVIDLPYKRRILVTPPSYGKLEKRIMAAYCGEPHESVNINGKWVDHFMSGKDRSVWKEIIACCNRFADALAEGDYQTAAMQMTRETDIRMTMTPDVLDDLGKELAESARKHQCGVRFTGAGGGGCVWALGDENDMAHVKKDWDVIVSKHEDAAFLPVTIAADGLRDEPVK